MPTKSKLMLHFEERLRTAGHDPQTLHRQTRQLLQSYRELSWRASLEDEPPAPAGDLSSGRALLEQLGGAPLAPQLPPASGYRQAVALMQRALKLLAAYPDNGALYHTILERAYFCPDAASDAAIWPLLHIERSTYYQRKQEAITLFANLMPLA